MITIACKDAVNQPDQIEVVAGVDTHQDTHTAVVIDFARRLLGHRQFLAARRGKLKTMHPHERAEAAEAPKPG